MQWFCLDLQLIVMATETSEKGAYHLGAINRDIEVGYSALGIFLPELFCSTSCWEILEVFIFPCNTGMKTILIHKLVNETHFLENAIDHSTRRHQLYGAKT